MNKEANMKTILDIAKECGAWAITTYDSDADDAPPNNGLVLNEAQLAATIEAWNRQNSEPIGHIYRNSAGQISIQASKNTAFDMSKYVGCALFTKPPQPQTVSDALEMAAKICDDLSKSIMVSHRDESKANLLSSTAKKIRALIDQPEPPASQEIIDAEKHIKDFHHDLNEAVGLLAVRILNDIPDYTNTPIGKALKGVQDVFDNHHAWVINSLQSKPAKG